MSLYLDAIETRANAATSGPWLMDEPDSSHPFEKVVRQGTGQAIYIADVGYQEDFEFIAAAREDVPALVAVARRQERVAELLTPILERTANQIGTHSATCYRYHTGCLARAVLAIVNDEREEQE